MLRKFRLYLNSREMRSFLDRPKLATLEVQTIKPEPPYRPSPVLLRKTSPSYADNRLRIEIGPRSGQKLMVDE